LNKARGHDDYKMPRISKLHPLPNPSPVDANNPLLLSHNPSTRPFSSAHQSCIKGIKPLASVNGGNGRALLNDVTTTGGPASVHEKLCRRNSSVLSISAGNCRMDRLAILPPLVLPAVPIYESTSKREYPEGTCELGQMNNEQGRLTTNTDRSTVTCCSSDNIHAGIA
jgi:hypothetical protein